MFNPRTLQEIEERFAASLSNLGSPANDLSPGSVLSTLIRAFSTVQLETELRLAEAAKTLSPVTAQNEDLDRLAATYKVFRKPADRASGFALLSTDTLTAEVSPGDELINLQNGQTYLVNTTGLVVLSSLTETAVPIVAFNPGSAANLPSGSPLIPSTGTPTNVRGFVGAERKPDGTFCGALVGGTDQESDTDFRQRLTESINQRRSGTAEAIRQELLELPEILNAWVRTETPGLVEVLLKTKDRATQALINRFSADLNAVLPVGVYAVLVAVRTLPLDLQIKTSPFPRTDLNVLDQQIKAVVNNYFTSLGLGDQFNAESLEILLSPLVRGVEVFANELTPRADQTLELGLLEISYV